MLGFPSFLEFITVQLVSRGQDSRMTREDVIALWRLADAEGPGLGKSRPRCDFAARSSRGPLAQGGGRVDLGQVVSVLRRAQLEAWEKSKFVVAEPCASYLPAPQGLTQGGPLPQPPASPADRDMILEAQLFADAFAVIDHSH